MSKKYLNESLTNRSARIILFNIYPRSINKASLLKRNDYFFNYFRLVFISQLYLDLVIILFHYNHEPILFIFKNSPTY
jgi:hypothetical protein